MEANLNPALSSNAPQARLSIKEKVGYSLGDAASNIYFQIFVVFLPSFYTNVFGISATAMGTMLLLTRVFDAVNDPLMGMIADRTNTRWGKFRPYIAVLALPLAVGGVLAFTTPDFSDRGMLIYAYITYSLLMVLYTAVNVPYAALMGVITPTSKERQTVSTYRFVAAFIGQLIIGSTALILVQRLGDGDTQVGWRFTMMLYGVLVVALLLGTFFLTKERVQTTQSYQGNIKEDLKDLFKNKPWVLIGAATVFQLTYIVMRGSATPYYFEFFVRDQELSLFGSTIVLDYAYFTSSFLTVGTFSTLAGAICTGLFTKKMDKKTTYASFLIASAGFSVFYFFLQPDSVLMIFVLNVLVSFFFGSVSVIQWAIYTDTADFGEWKFGRRATALIMAASLFALKLGLTLGGTFVGWILGWYGFEAGAVQTEETLTGIRMLMSFYPAIFGIIGGAIMLFYPLNDKKMIEIETDLTKRHAEDA